MFVCVDALLLFFVWLFGLCCLLSIVFSMWLLFVCVLCACDGCCIPVFGVVIVVIAVLCGRDCFMAIIVLCGFVCVVRLLCDSVYVCVLCLLCVVCL